MKPAEHSEEVLFREARQRPKGPEREAYLAGACAGNEALRKRLAALLQADESPDPFLEPPVGDLLSQMTTRPAPDSKVEEAGARIGRYKLLEKIGEGGCGVVYLAEQEDPVKRQVALKVIRPGMDSKQVLARFEAERQALALMDHPNIAKVLDAGATNQGRPFFVMELVHGVKITEYCDQNNLSTEQRLDLFLQACHAVQHAHQKGIIHRDIKPSNILVTVQDGKPVAKVIDFGIAKATAGQVLTDKTVHTAFEQFIGTPTYMSPEQAGMTALDIDTRSDIYSLGVLLYELLVGKTPFDPKRLVEAGMEEIRRIIREEEPPPPSTRLSKLAAEEQTTTAERRHTDAPQLIHRVRGDLDWIVMKALDKDRTRRYETANALASDVERHLSDEPVTAHAPSRVYRLQKLVRRHKLPFAAAGFMFAALAIGLGISLWSLRKANREATRSRQVAQFLQEMLQGVGPSVARGRDTTMLKEILDKTAERVGKDLKGQPEVEAELRSTIGGVYDALGEYQKAEAMHRSALILRRALWGNMNATVADSLDSLGWELLMQDKVDAAEPSFQEALAIRTNLLGSEHVQVAASLYHLGCVRLSQSPNPEAEPLLRQSLAMRRKLLGNANLEVAESLSGLSTALHNAGKPDQAEAAAREALAIQARVLPDERSAADAGITQLRLGLALLDQNRFAEAEPVVREAVTLRRNLLGSKHHNVAQALDVLAQVLVGETKLAEAEAVAREGLAISRKTIGEQHFTTADCLSNLGEALHKAGRFTEAEAALREALAIWRQLGNLKEKAANWNGAWVCSVLAAALRDQGKLSEVEALYRGEVETAINSPDPGSQAFAFVSVGDWLRTRGKLTEAEASYRAGSDIYLKVSPDNFHARQSLARGLALTLVSQGKLAEAEALYRETIEVGRSSNHTNDLANLLAGLGDLLRDQGKPAEAEPLYREGLDTYLKVSPDNFDVRQWLATGLALILRSQGKLNGAEALYRETIEVFRRSNHTNDLTTLLAGLADMFRDQGKLAEAEALYREGLDICRKASPDKFDVRQWLAGDLALTLQRQGKLAEAEPLYREAMTNAAKAWPNDPAKWQWQVSHLAEVLRAEGKSAEADKLVAEPLKPAAQAQPQGTVTGSDSQKGGKP
jgi:serine/threonine protein kinase/tetratricopeptide (TPR) repeat protein